MQHDQPSTWHNSSLLDYTGQDLYAHEESFPAFPQFTTPPQLMALGTRPRKGEEQHMPTGIAAERRASAPMISLFDNGFTASHTAE
jgi:hypothetical protein